MHTITDCPVCHQTITAERRISNTAICECGWTGSIEKKSEFKNSGMKNVCISLGLFGTLILSVMIHTANWDNYSFEIIPLKAKQWTSKASEGEIARVIQICKERKKIGCIEGAYEDLTEMKPENMGYLTHLALSQKDNENLQDAAESFRRYFKNGGKDTEVAYQYAQVLGSVGAFKDAEGYYKYVIKAKPRALQPKVMRDYVDMLVGQQKLRKARKMIHQFRKKSKRAAYFLEKQLQDINRKLSVAKL